MSVEDPLLEVARGVASCFSFSIDWFWKAKNELIWQSSSKAS